MFDPTIFDNLKVVLEGAIYDLDLDHEILVSNRADIVDLATLSRTYSIEFKLKQNDVYPRAEIQLHAGMKDLALEILEGNEQDAGCTLEVNFYTNRTDCPEIDHTIKSIWGGRPSVTQHISYRYGNEEKKDNQINIGFGRKINENQIDDLQDFIHFTHQTLVFLKEK